MPLAEVLRGDDEAFGAREPGREPEKECRAGPQHVLEPTARGAPDEHERRRCEIERDEPEDRSDLRHRYPLHIHAGVEDHDDRVADPERKSLSRVCIRNGERDDEEAAHPAEQQEPKPQQVGGNRVRQPGIAVVHPPDHREHHDDLHRTGSPVSAYEHGRQLRDREDEDEVEEELERRDASASIDQLGHDTIISECPVGTGRCRPRRQRPVDNSAEGEGHADRRGRLLLTRDDRSRRIRGLRGFAVERSGL